MLSPFLYKEWRMVHLYANWTTLKLSWRKESLYDVAVEFCCCCVLIQIGMNLNLKMMIFLNNITSICMCYGLFGAVFYQQERWMFLKYRLQIIVGSRFFDFVPWNTNRLIDSHVPKIYCTKIGVVCIKCTHVHISTFSTFLQ